MKGGGGGFFWLGVDMYVAKTYMCVTCGKEKNTVRQCRGV